MHTNSPFKLLIYSIPTLFLLLTSALSVNAQQGKNPVYVDDQGIMRWSDSKKEASFFGVNYTLPFAYGYRSHQQLGLDIKSSIDADVYHIARLGFDAFRVHVWDTEITDSLGNLKQNEHLELYDYLIAKLKERNIKVVVTPIAFWGNGYPEKDERTYGFSDIYDKGQAVTKEKAFIAQENFLKQFFQHKNKYTGLSFQEDEDIIAAEINNEPRHSGPKARATEYINRMAAAIRSTGWNKPVFYNISESYYYADAIAKADLEGFSFQWYPTGLVANHTLKGNYLPNVDVYDIPFDTIPEYKNKAKMIYEFDAGDVLSSYMYPAMARSFRGAGFQWATQFAYDPMGTAYANTEYQTHYINLAYTPKKAISLLIAGKAFHEVPLMKTCGQYPLDSTFESFRVSYKQDLSEMNSNEEFYYSNNTNSTPLSEKKLKHIAGVGSSPIVKYAGTGAYFLDKLDNGIWRLEIMPDAIHIKDPFAKASLKKEVTRIQWQPNEMRIHLAELGSDLNIKALNVGNNKSQNTKNGRFMIEPGTYLLFSPKKSKKVEKWDSKKQTGNLQLAEFVAPKANFDSPYVKHQPKNVVSPNEPFIISATTVGLDSSAYLSVLLRTWSGVYKTLDMQKVSPYQYEVEVPAEVNVPGVIEYRIKVSNKDQIYTYPGGYEGDPWAWDYYHDDSWTTQVATANTPLVLFNAAVDHELMIYPNLWKPEEKSIKTTATAGELSLQLTGDTQESKTMGFQLFVGDKVKERNAELDAFKSVVIKGNTAGQKSLKVNITFITKDAFSYSTTATLTDQMQEIKIDLNQLKAKEHLLLPRPYPGFHPLWFQAKGEKAFSLSEVEKLEITTDTAENAGVKTIEVATVLLQK
ncbi:glycoside hydrolase family 5 protein [Fulvivirga maritima]|uniref:cellulase family glycosylhydrolase n=1 Tax=Fulvivirga maritima TaxID=2904247 RepID=UPI001F2ED4CA|nr:cellulase family glycosylhydrolase [Fulvivirga maritima]UII24988.1 glycoside hydrolase family 5 protein [Fulvivirga maritima]